MKDFQTIINQLYKKYLTAAKQLGINFDLDFADTKIVVSNLEEVETEISRNLRLAFNRQGVKNIRLLITKNAVIITDDGVVPVKTVCESLKTKLTTVKSRVGFGTKATTKLL